MSRRLTRGIGRAIVAAATLSLAVLVTACSTPAATTAPSSAPPSASAAPINLDGTSWRLSDYVTPQGALFTVPAAITPLAEFTGGTMSGNAGCNTFSGPYSIQGDVIKVGHLLVTEIACQEPIASVEKAYLEALNLADKVAILDNGKLQLWDSASKSTLDFIQAN